LRVGGEGLIGARLLARRDGTDIVTPPAREVLIFAVIDDGSAEPPGRTPDGVGISEVARR
jgi:hypothetical protein